jgi:TatD DNase family protein
VPENGWVLETDAPYIPPEWLRTGGEVGRNEPVHLPRIAHEFAGLRGVSLAALAEKNRANAVAALPRLGAWLAASSR